MHFILKTNVKAQIYFFFQKSKFIWNAEKKRFDPLNFPGTDAGNFASLKKSVGLKTGAKLDFYREKYGLNKQVLLSSTN